MINVRQTTISDLNEVSDIFNQYRQFQGVEDDLTASKQFIKERYEQKESIIFIAEDGNKPVGIAQLYPMFSSVTLSRVFILNDLYVCKFRGKKA